MAKRGRDRRAAQKANRRKQGLARRYEPKSHYACLTDEQKAAIPPLAFFDLPREIRDMVYNSVFCLCMGCDTFHAYARWSVLVVDGQEIPVIGPRAEELALFRVSSQFYHESKLAFYKTSVFEINFDINTLPLRGSHYPVPFIPAETYCRTECLVNLRLELEYDIDQPNPNAHNHDLTHLLHRAVSLKQLQIAVSQHAPGGLRDYHCGGSNLIAPSGEPSVLLIGIVAQLVALIPANVNLKWGAWEELDQFSPDAVSSTWFVNGPLLEAVAHKYGKRAEPREVEGGGPVVEKEIACDISDVPSQQTSDARRELLDKSDHGSTMEERKMAQLAARLIESASVWCFFLIATIIMLVLMLSKLFGMA